MTSTIEKKDNIVIYEDKDGKIDISVKLEGESAWLTQIQLADLFSSTKQNISRHINNIFDEGELTKEATVKKYLTVQNKLHFAVSNKTAAEIIYSRADAEKDFMGLTSFKGKLPIKSDVSIAKNFLDNDELFRLNRLVSAFFDLAEIKTQDHIKMYMKDWVAELDKFIEFYGKGKLENSGSVSHEKAVKKAEYEDTQFQVKTLSEVEKDYLELIKGLEKKVNKKV